MLARKNISLMVDYKHLNKGHKCACQYHERHKGIIKETYKLNLREGHTH